MKSDNPFLLIHPQDRRVIEQTLKFCSGCSRVMHREKFGFNKSSCDGLQGRCFDCRKKYSIDNKALISKRNRARYRLNPEKWIARTAQYRKNNPDCRKREYWRNRDKMLSDHKAYYKKNRERLLQNSKLYVKDNIIKRRLYVAQWSRNKRKTDSNFRLKNLLRSRVYDAIKAQNAKKRNAFDDLLGCTIHQFKQHLAGQFRDGMNWDNHGSVWHIDHKKPCSKFDLRYPDQQRACFNFKNIQPLFVKENLSKWAHYPHPLCNAV